MFSRESLDRRLKSIREQQEERSRYILGPRDYEMPSTLEWEPSNNKHLAMNTVENIGVLGRNATNIERVQQQNLRDLAMMQKAQEELARARDFASRNNRPIKVNQTSPASATIVQQRQNRPQQGGRNRGPVAQGGATRAFSKKRWGKDGIPEVSDIKNKDPWQGKFGKLVSVNWRGKTFVVNGKVAPIFVGLLDDLWKAGYRPKSIGGYNDRNIAGTNTKSLHSYGYAIDIDPVQNPVQANDGSMQHILPPNIRAIAAKYGLKWGGDWNSYKDPMHFSMGYGGRE